jgi:hypothetical protein
MTASVQYWRLPEEEAELVAYLGTAMALPNLSVTSPEELRWEPVSECLRRPGVSFLITPPAFTSAMQVRHGADGYAASVVATPALLYTRGMQGDRWLTSTSLSCEWADFPADFTRWGKRVMQWVRRTVPNWHRYKHHRITAKAEAAREAGVEMMF